MACIVLLVNLIRLDIRRKTCIAKPGGQMNNVFFYAARDTEAYRLVKKYLTGLPFNGTLITLPPGSEFTSPFCLQLRSNDFIILFAEDEEDIAHLLALREEFDCFRIILVRNNEDHLKNNSFHLLSPRLIASFDTNIEEVSAYLASIFKK
jgi:hypothetical protein